MKKLLITSVLVTLTLIALSPMLLAGKPALLVIACLAGLGMVGLGRVFQVGRMESSPSASVSSPFEEEMVGARTLLPLPS